MKATYPMLAFTLGFTLVSSAAYAEESYFQRQVAPIFEQHCVRCHSGAEPKGGLDLTNSRAVTAGGASGKVIVPGKPGESRLLRLISGAKPEMPRNAPPLNSDQVARMEHWIQQGADWPRDLVLRVRESTEVWWSLKPVSRPRVPDVQQRGWVRTPIDAFILHNLEAKKLRPSVDADRRTLIRRLTYDLHGLPPTPVEIESFIRDSAPDAVEKLVDRLLASPRYGERWGRHWLDLARFGESQGYERDKIRDHAWRYRDYVIQSFNTDKPYSRFIQEQIAGDMLEPATEEGIVATGFLVAGPWDEVGNTQQGAVMRARVREEELEDLLSAVGQTFLGMTVNCARCHDHKFDPIAQRDYYRLKAVFEGVRHGDRILLTPTDLAERQQKLAAIQSRMEELDKQIVRLEQPARAKVLQARQASRPVNLPAPLAQWTFDGDARDQIGSLHGTLQRGARIEGGKLILDGKNAFVATEPLTKELNEKTLEAWVLPANLNQRGGGIISVETPDGKVFDAIVFGERESGKWLAGSNGFTRTQDLNAPPETASPTETVHLAVVYHADHRIAVYRNGKPYGDSYVPTGPNAVLRTFAPGSSRILFGLRHTGAGKGYFAGAIEEARLYNRALTAEDVAASFRFNSSAVSDEEIVQALDPPQRQRRDQWLAERHRLRDQHKALTVTALAYAVNPTQPEPTFVLGRGDVEKKKEQVKAGGLAAVTRPASDFDLPFDAPEGLRRRKFAEWLAHPENPLTPRVMVNRVWHYHFGKGIVATPSDLGFNGDRPSHPELLDWLAAELVAQNWSIKKLHRIILLSSIYRQASTFDAKAAAVDSDNRLLWRFSPRRLEGEAVRDAMLAVSGQLNPQMGGPSFRAFTLTVFNSNFYTLTDPDTPEFNRRTVYRMNVNSAKSPLLDAFDCPDPSVKSPARSVTTTPLQALGMMNNSFVFRQSRLFAERLARQTGEPAEQAALGYRIAFGREPTADETAHAVVLVRKHGLENLCWVFLNASEFVYVK